MGVHVLTDEPYLTTAEDVAGAVAAAEATAAK
jgi:hypothetical protein